jgi:toxin ParE1/3/4
MTIRLSSEADFDYAETVLFYLTEESPQSADRFTKELENTYQAMIEAPYRNRGIEFGLREKRVRGFPFSVIYSIEAEEIYVHAIYHDDRKRSALRHRL